MSSRVTGAGLALAAVALLAVALVTPVVLPAQLSLFAGHPTVNNHRREVQDVYVGLYSAQLCNTGGDGTCKTGDATSGFRAVGYAELALTGGLAASALALALLTLRRSERRKGCARLVWILGALAIACAGGLIAIGPFQGASAPVGLGMALHGAGVLGAMIAGLIAVRPPPPIRLRVADRAPPPSAGLPQAQAYARGSGGNAAQRPAPAPPHEPYAERQQLRPLYEANPQHGGTGGLLPPGSQIDGRSQIARGGIDRAAGAAVGGRDLAMASPPPMSPPPPSRMAAGVIHAPTPPPSAAAFADDEPHAAMAPFTGDESRPMPPLFGGEPPRPPFVEASRPMLPFANHEPGADASRPMPPYGHEASRPMLPFASPEIRPTVQQAAEPLVAPMATHPGEPPFASPFAAPHPGAPPLAPAMRGEPPPLPPPTPGPGARVKPTTAPPPIPARARGMSAPPPLPFTTMPPATPAGQAGQKPQTQVSLVPPMPDIDLPIAPPTAQIVGGADPDAGRSAESVLFPRAETPLAPPPLPIAAPLPIAPPPPVRLPRAPRDSQIPKPSRASVPMPARPGARTAPPPTQPPPGAPRPGGPRPTIAAMVPPIPAIPMIPPIPMPKRPDTDVTDAGDGDAAPAEVGDYTSQTDVSDPLSPDELAGADSPRDTSPSGAPVSAANPDAPTRAAEPLAPHDQPTRAAEPLAPHLAAAAAAARPTIQQPVPIVPGGALPKLPISTAPASLPPPRDSKQAAGPSPACPQCESPMAWVEEHLRFYCKSCRMYF